MGAGASVPTSTQLADGGVSAEARKFVNVFLPFCYTTEASKDLRNQAWRSVDNNGNGYVSLAETGKWIKDLIGTYYRAEAKPTDRGKGVKLSSKDRKKIKAASEDSVLLYKQFYPCYIRAFLDAADIGKNGAVKGTKTATKDDYVQRKEFRYLCIYLCVYGLMYDAFSAVDGFSISDKESGVTNVTKDDDRRITKEELAKASNAFRGHPLSGLKMLGMPDRYGNTDMIFAEMDADGKGKVLLKEWCSWLEDKEVEHKTAIGELLTYTTDVAE